MTAPYPDAPMAPAPPTAPPEPPSPRRRWPVVVAIVVGLAIVVILLLGTDHPAAVRHLLARVMRRRSRAS